MTVPETFKAAVVPEPRKQLIITDRTLQPVQPGEVTIKITATAINPIDWKMRDHNVFLHRYPAVLGSDGAGEVAAIGPDVSHFRVGDRVFFQGIIGNNDASTFQQFAKMDSKLVARTPSNVHDDEASTIPVTSVAALVALYDKTGRGLPAPWDKGGQRAGSNLAIVIIGGSSSMGQYAIQMARLSGYSEIITNSSPQHRNHLQGLGATAVLDRQATAADFAAAIGDTPLDFILDTISASATKQLSVDIVRAAKLTNAAVTKIVIVLVPELDFEEFDAQQEPKATLHRILGIGSFPQLRYLSEPFVKHLGGDDGYIARGLLKPNRPVVVPGGLASLEVAMEKSKEGVSGEKVVIRPFE